MMKAAKLLLLVPIAFVALKAFERSLDNNYSVFDSSKLSNKASRIITTKNNMKNTKKNMKNTTKDADAARRPLFLLHVGPGKTGTTTVQWGAAIHKELLEMDNIYYLGHFGRFYPEWDLHQLCRVCYDHLERNCTSRWEQLTSIINHHYEKGHDVFLSEEMLSGFKNEEDEMKNLWNHLDPLLSQWQVRILYSYRRYHEWLPSKWYQGYNPDAGIPSKNKLNWPDRGGKPIPSLRQYFDNLTQKRTFGLPHNTIQRWQSRYPNVRVYNMHNNDNQNTDFVTSFFCSMLPEAPTICKYLTKTNSTGAQIKNPSSKKVLHYDMLATGAYNKGMVDKKLSRVDVAGAIQIHAETKLGLHTLSDFQRECLTKHQTQQLLEMSIKYESELLPHYHVNGGKEELKSTLFEAVKSKQLCSIDLEKTLQEERWIKFFDKLNMETIQKLLSSST